MKLKIEQKVNLDTARKRALIYLAKQDRRQLVKANAIAIEIWPDHKMTSQGAGAAASRILKVLEKEGLVAWRRQPDEDWGYRITTEGRSRVNTYK